MEIMMGKRCKIIPLEHSDIEWDYILDTMRNCKLSIDHVTPIVERFRKNGNLFIKWSELTPHKPLVTTINEQLRRAGLSYRLCRDKRYPYNQVDPEISLKIGKSFLIQ